MTTQEPAAPDNGASTAEAPPVVKVVCANCGAELLGEYCYRCGQPVKGMIRPLSSMMHDIADTIFNIDSRIFRTLWPLLARPGYLSNEYFSGRRVRFVTPFRLYFFLSIAAFFAMQLWIGDMTINGVDLDEEHHTSVTSALTKEEVIARRDTAIAALEATKNAMKSSSKIDKVQKKEDQLRDKADARIKYLDAVADAKAKGTRAAPRPECRRRRGPLSDKRQHGLGSENESRAHRLAARIRQRQTQYRHRPHEGKRFEVQQRS